MANFNLSINGQNHQIEADPDTPVLWVLRDAVGLVGTKYGCGISQCGACTIHLDGQAARSCSVPVSEIGDKKITTIEGFAETKAAKPLLDAWREHDVPQCGYCQAGQIMNAATLLKNSSNPSDEEIEAKMNGNLCRCGTYLRVKAAIKTAAANL